MVSSGLFLSFVLPFALALTMVAFFKHGTRGNTPPQRTPKHKKGVGVQDSGLFNTPCPLVTYTFRAHATPIIPRSVETHLIHQWASHTRGIIGSTIDMDMELSVGRDIVSILGAIRRRLALKG